MRIFQILIAAVVLSLAGSAQAVVKFYSSDPGNGEPGNTTRISINLCPPFISSPDTIGGYQKLTDDELGSVELSEFVLDAGISGTTDLSGDILVPIFGPGAFVFIFNNATTSISAPHVSGAGGGPGVTASTAPTTGSIAWGVVSGFTITGVRFCLASPTTICSENGFSHGMTVPGVLPSTTYNLAPGCSPRSAISRPRSSTSPAPATVACRTTATSSRGRSTARPFRPCRSWASEPSRSASQPSADAPCSARSSVLATHTL